MSSCGASCSICFHLATYVSATSASSPNAKRASLPPLCFQLLSGSEKMAASPASPSTDQTRSLWNCPVRCNQRIVKVERLSAAQLLLRSPPQTRPVRSMKHHLHPRPLPVLRHTRRSRVSSGQNTSDANLSIRPRQANLLLHPALQSAEHPRLSLCLILHPFRPIQST